MGTVVNLAAFRKRHQTVRNTIIQIEGLQNQIVELDRALTFEQDYRVREQIAIQTLDIKIKLRALQDKVNGVGGL